MREFWNIVDFEYKKLRRRKLVWIISVLALALCVFSACSHLLGNYYVEGELYDSHFHKLQVDSEYARKLSGRTLDTVFLQEIQDAIEKAGGTDGLYWASGEYQTYVRPYDAVISWIMNLTGARDFSKMTEQELYRLRTENLEKLWEIDRLSEGEKAHLRELEQELEVPFTFEYCEGYVTIMEILYSVGILISLVIAVSIPGLFIEEHSRKTDQLVLCTLYGKKLLYGAKAFVGLTWCLIMTLLLDAAVAVPALLFYGTEGFGAQLQMEIADASWSMTVGEGVLLLIGLSFMVALIQCTVAMFLAECSKNSVLTMAVMTGGLILTTIFTIPDEYRVFSQIWDSLPCGILAVWNAFSERMIHFAGRYWTTWQAIPVIYGIITILLLLLGKRIFENFQVEGR